MAEDELRKTAERLVNLLIIDLREHPRIENAISGIPVRSWEGMVDELYERAGEFLLTAFGATG